MVRAIFIFAVAALGATGVAWLVEYPGWVTVDWFGFRLEAPMIVIALVLVLTFAGLYILLRFLNLITGGPAAWRAFSSRQRARQGMGALTQGLAAAAAGDASKAHRHAARAERLITDGPLARVLALEAAELEGRADDVAALAPALLDDPETELLGRRALFDLARASAEQDRATDQAEAAFENHPAAGWAAEALLADALRQKEWNRAKSVLARATRHDAFSNGRPEQLKAALMLTEAMDWERRDETQKALALARKAHETDAGLVAAAVMVAEHSFRAGKLKRAREVVQDLWGTYPHPALGRVFAELNSDESQEDRLARLHELVSANPDHTESRLLFAKHAIAARNVTAARDALKDLLVAGTSARAFALMASLDKAEHGAAAAPEDWIEKALTAPRDGVWVCSACGQLEQNWGAVCPRCVGVATAQWATHLGTNGNVHSPARPAAEPAKASGPDAQAASLPPKQEVRAALPSGGAEASGAPEALAPPDNVPSRQPDDPGADKKNISKEEAAW